MNIEEFASLLDGRDYGDEITKEEERMAKELGYVVVFGCSDDITEFRGAIDNEVGSLDGRKILINKDGIFEECECNCKYSKLAKKDAKIIEAIWDGENGYSWEYKTTIHHAEFDIYEDRETYCRGMVFNINDISI